MGALFASVQVTGRKSSGSSVWVAQRRNLKASNQNLVSPLLKASSVHSLRAGRCTWKRTCRNGMKVAGSGPTYGLIGLAKSATRKSGRRCSTPSSSSTATLSFPPYHKTSGISISSVLTRLKRRKVAGDCGPSEVQIARTPRTLLYTSPKPARSTTGKGAGTWRGAKSPSA